MLELLREELELTLALCGCASPAELQPSPRAAGTGRLRIFGLRIRPSGRPDFRIDGTAHPRDESLSRVHGVGALFSAAYGNVGSSIYYALGVTAAFALGLTPIAFVISGLIFMFTAATYAEATVMYPEAGGSSSFARHAFNEMVSFIAAWGQMLNYMITVAISAYFVPHYLAVFWEPAGPRPGRHHRRRGADRRPRAAQRPRLPGVGASSTWYWPWPTSRPRWCWS